MSRVSWHMINGVMTLIKTPAPDDITLCPAPIVFVCMISGEGWKLGPEGNFNHKFADKTPLYKAKLSASGTAGFVDAVRKVFPSILSGFAAIQSSKTRTKNARNQIVVPTSGQIRFRHSHFRVCGLLFSFPRADQFSSLYPRVIPHPQRLMYNLWRPLLSSMKARPPLREVASIRRRVPLLLLLAAELSGTVGHRRPLILSLPLLTPPHRCPGIIPRLPCGCRSGCSDACN